MSAVVSGIVLGAGMPARTQSDVRVTNQASFTYTFALDADTSNVLSGHSNRIELIDPRGRVRGSAGEVLPDYQGWTVGLYEPDPKDLTYAEVRQLTSLTRTGRGDPVSIGIEPNTANANPYPLSNGDQGAYSFLLNGARGQLDPGRVYVLIVTPVAGSAYKPRRIRLVLGPRNDNLVTYTATALDGAAITATDGRETLEQTFPIQNVGSAGLVLAAINLSISVYKSQEIQIVKTADRASAEPGDTVVYHLVVTNRGDTPLHEIRITDDLPGGFHFVPASLRSQRASGPAAVVAERAQTTLRFALPDTLDPGQALDIVYAVVLNPESLRGTGQSSASVTARAVLYVNDQPVGRLIADGPAVHTLRVRRGILTDTGTLIGRVFEDANFDGEQNGDEPGVAQAVILLDDGNRITTDENGLFSVANTLCGYHSAVLDLSSLPDHALAPNHRFRERNSPSRLAHLAPGGMARINFAVISISPRAKTVGPVLSEAKRGRP